MEMILSSIKSMAIRKLFVWCFGLAAFIRIILIIYASWQDSHMIVKYTDIDYEVITDGARYVTQSQSPYKRSTYRYTPILAYIMTPNILFTKVIGKFIFLIADLLIGLLIYRILKVLLYHSGKCEREQVNRTSLYYTSLWLFNPFSVNVSTRGNAESLVVLLVLLTLYFLIVKENYIIGGILYGFSIHFKIYPIVYCLALFFFIDSHYQAIFLNKNKEKIDRKVATWKKIFYLFFNKKRITFTLLTIFTLSSLTILFYWLYGYEFLYETYLYHLTRKDNRHNFSLHFYDIYLRGSLEETTNEGISTFIVSTISFIPQILLILTTTYYYYSDIHFSVFIQTLIFVVFNKVCTVQYFCWYLSLMPLVIPFTNFKLSKGVILISSWISAMGLWFYFAYNLEFKSMNTFFQLWLAGVFYFLVNLYIIYEFVKSYIPICNKNVQSKKIKIK